MFQDSITGNYSNRNYEVKFPFCFSGIAPTPGVYVISGVNKVIGRDEDCLYIGSSVDLKERKYTHFHNLAQDKHFNPILQNMWNKYMEEDFVFLELEKCSRDECVKREQNWIDYYSDSYGFDSLINISEIAGKPPPLTKEQREKLSKEASERWSGEKNPMFNSCRFGEKNPFYGKKQPEELKEKNRLSIETRRDRLWGKDHRHSEESKEIMRIRATGRRLSDEAKRKVSAFFKGRKNLKNARPVVQLKLEDLSLIKIHDGASYASKELKIDTSSIGRVCKKKQNHAGGFFWMYKEDYDKTAKSKNGKD